MKTTIQLHGVSVTIESADVNATQTTPAPIAAQEEIYIGAIINAKGEGHHVFLLPGDHEANWADSLEWAKSIGGDLPTRVEQALLFADFRNEFEERAYWSNEQHAADSGYAWYQYFNYGSQGYDRMTSKLRARSVRRSKF